MHVSASIESLHYFRGTSPGDAQAEQENTRPRPRPQISGPIPLASSAKSASTPKRKPGNDVIDRLDSTGNLYGVDFHHSGPFDAVNHKRKGPSPMAAFSNPASPQQNGKNLRPPQASNARASGKLSPRAQAALSAMDTLDLNGYSTTGPYGAAKAGKG